MRTVLVTGASAGLGLALAKRLIAYPDYRVIVTARASSLSRCIDAGIVESERVWLRALDVVDPVQRALVIGEAERRWDGVDILINNAGVSYRSVVEHVSEIERLAQMDINFRSPMELARLVLPGMRRKHWGRIVNVSSVSGMMAMPTMAVYAASKFALEGATESLWYEVKPWNIKVTLVQPGFINSSSFQQVRMTELSAQSADDHRDPYHRHYRHMAPFVGRMMRRAFATPDTVARTIIKIIQRDNPPLRISATIDAWVFAMLRRFLPRRLYHAVLYKALPSIGDWGTPKELPSHVESDPSEPASGESSGHDKPLVAPQR